jgi:predicted nucleotidyltransferase
MASTVELLSKAGLITPPSGFYIPAADKLFPHLRGHIMGFEADPTTKRLMKCYQNHHVWFQDREYDLNIYSITQYFKLCLDNNPNMVDTLFTPRDCVLHSTVIAEMVRERRESFLHKKCWDKYKGYAYSQLHKMRGKNPEKDSKRDKLRERYGFDVKYAYHLVRLLLECEMIMTEQTIDIRRHQEHLKAIRRGEVSQEQIERWYAEKEVGLEKAYHESKLRAEPARDEIKNLLLACLEHHYGSLSALETVRNESNPDRAAMREIQTIIERVL